MCFKEMMPNWYLSNIAGGLGGLAHHGEVVQRRIWALRTLLVEANPWMPIFFKLSDF